MSYFSDSTCIVCGIQYTPTSAKQKTCGNKKCQRAMTNYDQEVARGRTPDPGKYGLSIEPCVECGNAECIVGKNPRCQSCIDLDETSQSKWCFVCKHRKPIEAFREPDPRRLRAPEKRSACRECESLLRLTSQYNITPERYFEILEEQGGRCAICRTADHGYDHTYRGWHIDHDHACCPGKKSCGKCVRGILCGNCNGQILGGSNDDPYRLIAAAQYLIDRSNGFSGEVVWIGNDPDARRVFEEQMSVEKNHGPMTIVVRSWAKNAGLSVAVGGNLSQEVLDAYFAAHPDQSRNIWSGQPHQYQRLAIANMP